MLRLRLGVQGIQAVGVVDVGVRILRLGVDRLVGRGEVGRLEIGIRGVGQRRGAGVGRLTYSAQLGQPCRPVAGAVVTVLEESKTERGRKNEAQDFSYPSKSIPQAQLWAGRRSGGEGGINYYTVRPGKHPRSEAGLSKNKQKGEKKKSKEIRIGKYNGRADSPEQSSQRREDIKESVL